MTLVEQVQAKYPNLVMGPAAVTGEQAVYIRKEGVRPLALSLKNDPDMRFDMLMDLFAVDYLHWEEKADRFEVVYNLFSSSKNHRLILKVAVPETDASVDSVSSIWPAADWFERETWDMMGIVFRGHPNLKRILMYESFEGHALRKDYPYNKRQPIAGARNG